MSTYTTLVRWMVEQGTPLALSSYPIFDEAYRPILNKKIQDHFYFREIGFETVGLFNNRLAAKMNEIMPLYNKLYESALIEISPLDTRSYKETISRETDGTTKENMTENKSEEGTSAQQSDTQRTAQESSSKQASESGEGSGKTIGSDTPQSMIEAADIDANMWASQAQLQKEKSSNEQTEEATHQSSDTSTQRGTVDSSNQGTIDQKRDTSRSDTENIIRMIQESSGSQSELLMKYRETFLNIDMMVIDELEELFMQIY